MARGGRHYFRTGLSYSMAQLVSPSSARSVHSAAKFDNQSHHLASVLSRGDYRTAACKPGPVGGNPCGTWSLKNLLNSKIVT